jgi:hypothetical protein
MRLKFGQQTRVKWIDAFGISTWTDEDELTKLIKAHSKPENQTLYFIKQTDEFYIFTSGKPTKGEAYIDIHGIPRGWVVELKPVR